MKQYLDLVQDVLENGVQSDDRTGTGTLSVFGRQIRFDLREGFPLVTTKKVFTKGVVGELLWFLRGETNIKWLNERGIHIWDEWADSDGELGPLGYSSGWRNWCGSNRGLIDQIDLLIQGLIERPNSRRHIVSAWEVDALPDENLTPQDNVSQGLMALAPCHMMFQMYLRNGALSCHMYQRSADLALGVPFNIASYALLTHIIAKEIGSGVGDLIISFGDVHIYKNHVSGLQEQVKRTPLPLPTLKIMNSRKFDEYQISDFEFEGYQHHPPIKFEISV